MENSLTGAADTIFALSSAPGRAAIAVVRISGPGANRAVDELVGRPLRPRLAALVDLVAPETGLPLDSALAIRFAGPASATGEDAVEFHVHGGRAVVASVLDALGRLPGFRPAEPGEFARRAFANGKLDLTQAEGLADLIDAETEQQRVQAFRQARGALFELYDGWRDRLIEAMALTEAAIDFSDEADVADGALRDARERAAALHADIGAHLASANRGEIIRDGFRVALAGAPNVGKSSLMNALAGRDVAIVTPEAGTTRDILEVRLDLDGLVCVVSDTAGLRETEHAIEREGIRRAETAIGAADLVVWLAEPMTDAHAANALRTEATAKLKLGANVLLIASKSDLVPRDAFAWADLTISAQTGSGLDRLTAAIAERARAAAGDMASAPPTTERHRAHLARALEHLEAHAAKSGDLPELAAEDLRLAATELGRLTGRVDPEDVLGAIFGRFCIGK
jgi:tRNA modification GTPase